MNEPTLLEISLRDPSDFLKIMETLTRMGVPVVENGVKILYQSCHILHKRQRYYVVHFKEMFLLDGRDSQITEEDVLRRNAIALLLEDWGLCRVVRPDDARPHAPKTKIKIIKHAEKSTWVLQPKYAIGTQKGNR